MKKTNFIIFTVGLWLILSAPVAAQTPRPTPTNIPANSSSARGSISGFVYLDVNGDGVCVDSGVEGEVAVENINLQFTSSDKETMVPLFSGEDGSYGLVAAGESHWEVLVIPPDNMIVTSTNPQFVPVYINDVLDHTDINFCIASGTAQSGAGVITLNTSATESSATTQTTDTILAPEAGASRPLLRARTIGLNSSLILGILLILAGVMIGIKERVSSKRMRF